MPLLPRLGPGRIALLSLKNIFEVGPNFPNRVVRDHAADEIEFNVDEVAGWISTPIARSAYTFFDVYVAFGGCGVSDFALQGRLEYDTV